MNYQQTKKNLLEGSDQKVYATIKNEILRCKGAQARLDNVVDTAIFAGLNQLKNSVSLNRLNALACALNDSKETARLAKLERVIQYAKLIGIVYNKQYKLFIFTDYAAAKSLMQNYTLPSVNFSQWLKENKAKKENKAIEEKEAIAKLRNTFIAMRASQHIAQSDKFVEIMHHLELFIQEHDQDGMALIELEKMKSIIN